MNDILKELSWPLKLKILNQVAKPSGKIAHEKPWSPSISPVFTSPHPEPRITSEHEKITPIENSNVEPTASIEVPPTMEKEQTPLIPERRVGIQFLKEVERRDNAEENDEKDMRLKLFRLMYETVRDSDLKVKRAELIKDHYANSSSFEIGYLAGDITDKSNIITDIATTLKRFHREWKPIEHINAYEQIANQAIEITHLIDLVRVVNKRDSGT